MVAHSFPRWEGDFAGAFVWRLAQALAEHGHQVTAIAPADRGESGAPTLGDVRVRRNLAARRQEEADGLVGMLSQDDLQFRELHNFYRAIK